MTQIKGVCPIIATPFSKKGELDTDSLRSLLRALILGGCHGLTLFGIAGEYYKLTDEECRRMSRIVVDECRDGGIPSILSVTRHSAEVAVRQAKEYEAAGADCLMVLPPFFLKPGPGAICDHIRQVAEAVSVPILVQYAPEQTGVGIPVDQLASLCEEHPNIRYYKIECKPPGPYLSALLDRVSNNAGAFVGNAGFQMIEGFDRGAIGIMPGCSMFDLYLTIYQAYFGGNRLEAADIHTKALLPMLNHIRQDVEMIIALEKRILARRGFIESDYCRQPGYMSDPIFDRMFEELYAIISPYFTHADTSKC